MKLTKTVWLLSAVIIFAVSNCYAIQDASSIDDTQDIKTERQTAESATLTDEDGTEFKIRYWQYVPKDKKTKKLPLMIFLHGAGERGEDLSDVKKWGPPKLIESGKDFPAVVISPQCPKNKWWKVDQLKALFDHIAKEHKTDPDRVYITGLSMGGFGTWGLLAKYPEYFAAAVPICGGGKPATAKSFYKVPIWAFHGDADRVVPVKGTNDMIAALKEAGGKPKVTLYEGVNHNSWSQTYANKEMFEWMFAQKRTEKEK